MDERTGINGFYHPVTWKHIRKIKNLDFGKQVPKATQRCQKYFYDTGL